jgi:hypothetical protein
MMTEQDILDLTDAVSNAVDDWVRAGGGTYEELADVVEQAIRRIAERGKDASGH